MYVPRSMLTGIKVATNLDSIRSQIDFYLRVRTGPDTFSYAQNIVFEPIEEGAAPYPAFALGMDEAQVLMNELWRWGIRPSNGEGSVGEIAAVKYHLEDMRKLVFTKPREVKSG